MFIDVLQIDSKIDNEQDWIKEFQLTHPVKMEDLPDMQQNRNANLRHIAGYMIMLMIVSV